MWELSLFGEVLSGHKTSLNRDMSVRSPNLELRRFQVERLFADHIQGSPKENTTMQDVLKRICGMVSACIVGAAAATSLSAQSVTTTMSKNPGSSSYTAIVTNANGKTATYQNNATWGNGGYTDDRSITGFNGKTASANTSAAYAPGSTARQTTVTGFNGRSATYDNNRNWGSGSYSDARSYRGFGGATRSDTVTRSHGLVTNTFTGRNGNSRTVARFARYRR
jgi:hypothetical protein